MSKPNASKGPKPEPETVTVQLHRGPDRIRTVAGATVTRHARVQVKADDWAATLERRPEFAGYVTPEE